MCLFTVNVTTPTPNSPVLNFTASHLVTLTSICSVVYSAAESLGRKRVYSGFIAPSSLNVFSSVLECDINTKSVQHLI